MKKMVENLKLQDAGKRLQDNYFNKPEEFITLDKLQKSLELDRKLTVSNSFYMFLITLME